MNDKVFSIFGLDTIYLYECNKYESRTSIDYCGSSVMCNSRRHNDKKIYRKSREIVEKGSDFTWCRLSYTVCIYICAEDDVRKMIKMHVYKELQIYIILWCVCARTAIRVRVYYKAGGALASLRSVVEEKEEKGNTRKCLLSCGLRADRHGRGGKSGVVL